MLLPKLKIGWKIFEYKMQTEKVKRHQFQLWISSKSIPKKIKMNSYTIILGLALIVAAAAYGHGSSYNSRSDHYDGHHEVSEDSHGHDGHDDKHHDYHHHPSYKYEYGIHDPKSKVHTSQWEHRDGDTVHGEYTLDEADGTKRVVKYSSDKKGGFTAHVERIGHAEHPAHYEHHDDGHHH
jgi:Insect cuticle protein